jgi:hypothetical protein
MQGIKRIKEGCLTTYILVHKPTGNELVYGPQEGSESLEYRSLVPASLAPDEVVYEARSTDEAIKKLSTVVSGAGAWDALHGCDFQDFEIKRVTRTIQVAQMECQMPIGLKLGSEPRRRIPLNVAKGYVGEGTAIYTSGKLYVSFVEIPHGHTFESLKKACDVAPVRLGSRTVELQKCLAVFETPQTYSVLFGDKPNAGMITTDLPWTE